MSFNAVTKSMKLGTVKMKNNKTLEVCAALVTEEWKRTEETAKTASNGFYDSVKSEVDKGTKIIPGNAAKITMRESSHGSKNDSKKHFSAVVDDSKGNHLKAVHIPVKE